MLIWKVVGEPLTGGEIHVNSKWDLLPRVGLRCTVFILWDFAAFLCLWDCLLNCASSALSAQSAVCFLYPDLEQGSWVQLMMIKDTWKRQSGTKPGFRSSVRVDQPCAATSSPLRGASQTGPGNHLVKCSMSRHRNCGQLQDELQQDWHTAGMLLFICCNNCTNGAASLFLACFLLAIPDRAVFLRINPVWATRDQAYQTDFSEWSVYKAYLRRECWNCAVRWDLNMGPEGLPRWH